MEKVSFKLWAFFTQCYALLLCHSLAPPNKSLRKWDVYVLWRSQSQSYNPLSRAGRAGCSRGGDGEGMVGTRELATCDLPSCQVNPALLSPTWRAHLGSCPLACPHQQMERLKREGGSSLHSRSATPGWGRREGLRHWEGTRCPASTCGCSPGRIWEDFP